MLRELGLVNYNSKSGNRRSFQINELGNNECLLVDLIVSKFVNPHGRGLPKHWESELLYV